MLRVKGIQVIGFFLMLVMVGILFPGHSEASQNVRTQLEKDNLLTWMPALMITNFKTSVQDLSVEEKRDEFHSVLSQYQKKYNSQEGGIVESDMIFYL